MNDDFLDLLSELSAVDARFLIVGAYAVGIHGRPRATKDLDIWVDPTPDNAQKVMEALLRFGAPLHGLTEQELATPGLGFMMGIPPHRIDLLTRIIPLRFDEAWSRRIEADVGRGLRCPFIGLDDLIINKKAAGREQDLADVAALERLKSGRRA